MTTTFASHLAHIFNYPFEVAAYFHALKAEDRESLASDLLNCSSGETIVREPHGTFEVLSYPEKLALAFLLDDGDKLHRVFNSLSHCSGNRGGILTFLRAWGCDEPRRSIFTLGKMKALKAFLEYDYIPFYRQDEIKIFDPSCRLTSDVLAKMILDAFLALNEIPIREVMKYESDIIEACGLICSLFDKHNARLAFAFHYIIAPDIVRNAAASFDGVIDWSAAVSSSRRPDGWPWARILVYRIEFAPNRKREPNPIDHVHVGWIEAFRSSPKRANDGAFYDGELRITPEQHALLLAASIKRGREKALYPTGMSSSTGWS